MSHFVCTLGAARSDVRRLDSLLEEVTPCAARRQSIRRDQGSSHLLVHTGCKAIRDVSVIGRDGSWLAVIGTPVLEGTEEQRLGLLEAFLKDGAACLLGSIDGNFAALGYDAARGVLWAATDMNNTTPIYYALANGIAFLASHELVLAKHLGAAPDPVGVAQWVHLGMTWAEQTRFKSLARIPACHICLFDGSEKVHSRTYWCPSAEVEWTEGFEGQLDKWKRLLRDAVWRYHECSGCRPVIADLTAGEDTRFLVAQCHALGIPFTAHVTGYSDDIDVRVARGASSLLGFPLLQRQRIWPSEEEVLADAMTVILAGDGYLNFLRAWSDYFTDLKDPIDDYGTIKFCGIPGGAAFRGSYYLHGKAPWPWRHSLLDARFFTKLKYLLDFAPGLTVSSDEEFLEATFASAHASVDDVSQLPIGTQIDHLLRVYQTCSLGLMYKGPLYLPTATRDMTRSIYGLSPRYKRGGRLTKACTELLYPELAVLKTQTGVPTIRRTLLREPLFLPEHIATARHIMSGTLSRLLSWTQPKKWYASLEHGAPIFSTLLTRAPYNAWFSSPTSMLTGELYRADAIDSMLADARRGILRSVPVLGRIMTLELACRWVQGEVQP